MVVIVIVVDAAVTAEVGKVELVVEATLFSQRNNYQIQEASLLSR